MITDFALVDLSLLDGTKPFDGMAAGRFTDMFGRDTVFLPEELPSYVANTKLALGSTRNASGEVVGFPIDTMNHDGGLAAGWIVDVNLSEGRNVIEFTPRWNDLGRGSIGADTMRFFSPTIDTEAKVIIGGSLTNWPATRTREHQILLRPVELSAQMQTYETAPIVTLFDVFKTAIADLKLMLSGLGKPAPLAEAPEPKEGVETMPEDLPVAVELAAPTIPTIAVDLSSPDIQSLITSQANARAETILAERAHAAEIVTLATRLIGGTPEQPQGLPVAHEQIVSFLQAIPADLYPEASSILSAAATRDPIQFAEIGHSRVVQGTKPLPECHETRTRKLAVSQERRHDCRNLF